MNLPEGFSLEDVSKLRAKVEQENKAGIDHIRDARERKRNHMHKLLMRPSEEGRVKVHKVWKNLKLRKAIFLNDEEDITIVNESGALGVEVSDNANKVIKFDSIDMNMREDKEQIITDDGMFGLGVVMIDGYDDEEQQPIRSVINPLTCYGDPRAWNTSNMAYFGTDIVKSYYEMEASPQFFNLEKLHENYAQAIEDFEKARNSANGTRYSFEQVQQYKKDGKFSLVNHITTYNGKVYLTTWDSPIETLVRIIELRELTSREKKRPDKVDLGVTIYRANPIPYSFFGASLFDEIEQYQDLATLLTNLQVMQAERVGQGPNKYVDSRLGLPIDQIQNKPLSGAIIEFTPDEFVQNLDARSGIQMEQMEQISQFPTQMMQMNDNLMDDTLAYNTQQVFGQSQAGGQTKAEIQTLQENANTILRYMGENYMQSHKHYWKNHIMCYAINMMETDKKIVTLFASGRHDSYTFKKSDFVPDGKITLYVKSKVQEDLQDEKDFARLSVMYNNIIGNLKQGSARFNKWVRMYIDKSGVKGLSGIDMLGYNKDEVKAQNVIESINRKEYEKSIFGPEMGDDADYILEELELAVDNEFRDKAIIDYTSFRDRVARLQPQQPMQETGKGNAQSAAMASNMLASQSSQQTPSISQV